jgi:hypothetical protein
MMARQRPPQVRCWCDTGSLGCASRTFSLPAYLPLYFATPPFSTPPPSRCHLVLIARKPVTIMSHTGSPLPNYNCHNCCSLEQQVSITGACSGNIMQSPIPCRPVTPDTEQRKEKSHNGDAADAQLVSATASKLYSGTVRRVERKIMNELPVKVWLESNEGMFLQLCLVLDSSARQNIKIALFHGSTCSTSTKKHCVRIQVSPILRHPCIPARYKRNLLKENSDKIYLKLNENREFLDECFGRLLEHAFCRGILGRDLNLFYSPADDFTRFFAHVMTKPELHIEFCRIVNIAESAFICPDNSRLPTFEKLMQVIEPGEDRAAPLERFRRHALSTVILLHFARM